VRRKGMDRVKVPPNEGNSCLDIRMPGLHVSDHLLVIYWPDTARSLSSRSVPCHIIVLRKSYNIINYLVIQKKCELKLAHLFVIFKQYDSADDKKETALRIAIWKTEVMCATCAQTRIPLPETQFVNEDARFCSTDRIPFRCTRDRTKHSPTETLVSARSPDY